MTDNGAPTDIGAIIAAHPSEMIELPTAAVLASGLGFGELLDVSEVTGVAWKSLGAAVAERDAAGEPTISAARIMLAIAWVLRRRGAPAVTWADAQRWQLRPAPESAAPDPKLSEPAEQATIS